VARIMVISADLLRIHLDYTAWASARLVNAAGLLNPEELTRDFGTADRSVLGTLAHVYAADRVWLGQIEGNQPERFLDPERDVRLSVLQNDWPVLLERWKRWAATLDDGSVQTKVVCRNRTRGWEREIPVWQIVLHVVNHGAHHRGQVAGFLRGMGHTPPVLDLMAYYFEKAQPASGSAR
jgi:uncharacterized damage-inducible protein DinB